MNSPAVLVDGLSHRYGERLALNEVSFSVTQGEIFGLLGPNGGGKSTLFRVLSTLLPLQNGFAKVFGADVANEPDAVRHHIGVTFQTPSLDLKLTVRENLVHQGHLYGLMGQRLRQRCDDVLQLMGVADRQREFAEKLSGGLKRRVEIAKTLLHAPQLLLLDEPSTGLDPRARAEMWETLARLNREADVTVLVSTHLMDEAERCSRLGILDGGALIASGTPLELRRQVGGDSLVIEADDLNALQAKIAERLGCEVQNLGNVLRIEREQGHELLSEIAVAFPGEFRSLTIGKPTLEDVFIKLTGRRLDEAASEVTS